MKKYRVLMFAGHQVTTRSLKKAESVLRAQRKLGMNCSIIEIRPVNKPAAIHFFNGVKKR